MESNGVGPIYKKLSEIMKEVSRIPKNGYNEFHRYKYATESDVSEHIRPLLSSHGLSIRFDVMEVERIQVREPTGGKDYPGDITRVKLIVSVGDESGVQLDSTVYGEGQDKGDKGLYKAYTGAVKYWLFKTFLISTGDDPELEGKAAEKPKTSSSPQPTPPVQQSTQDPKPRTDAQHRKMYALMKTAEMDKDTVIAFSEWLKMLDEVETTKLDGKLTFTMKSASHIIENFPKYLDEYRQKESQYADGNPIQR